MRAVSAAVIVAPLTLLLAAACAEATQFELVLTTDIPCTMFRSAVINVATSVDSAQAQISDRIVDATTMNCKQISPDVAEIGNIFVVPGDGQSTDSIGAVVVRVGVDPVYAQDCLPPLYRGCVVAKRTFRYVPHTTLHLPIKAPLECLDFPCSSELTCVAKDKCVSTEYSTIPQTRDAGSAPTPSKLRAPNFTCALDGKAALFCKDFEDKVTPPTGMLRTEANGGAIYVEPSTTPGLSSLVSEMATVSSAATASVQDLAVAAHFFAAFDAELIPDAGPSIDPSTGKEIARIRRADGDVQSSILIGWGNNTLRFSREANGLDAVSFDATAGWHRIAIEKTERDVILSVDGVSKSTVWPLPSPFGFRVGLTSGGPKRKVRYDNILVTNLP